MSLWDGLSGKMIAGIMARTNADMERRAVDELGPAPGDAVLEVGFGPGVGVKLLAERVGSGGWVGGADPSAAMLRSAQRRNRAAVRTDRVRLAQAPAHELPWNDATFDGAIAVNSMQLWDPFEASVAEVRRVLKPGARLVTLTHDWAIKRHAPLEDWIANAIGVLERNGFRECRTSIGRARSGGTVALSGRRDG